MSSIVKKILKKCRKVILLEVFVCIVLRVILLVNPILYSKAVNNLSSFLYYDTIIILIIFILTTSVYRLFDYFRQYTYYYVYNKIYREFTSICMKHTYNNSIFSLSRFTQAEYMNIFNTDMDTISSFLTNGIYRVVQLLEVFIIYYYFFITSKTLFILTIFFSLIVIVFVVYFSNKVQYYNRQRKVNYDKRSGAIGDVFNGIKEIKGFNIGKNINNKISRETINYTDSKSKYSTLYNTINIVAVYIFEMLRLFVFIYGVYQISQGQLQLGILLVIYSYYQKIIDNFSLFSTINLEYKNFKMSLSRINKLIEYSKEVKTDLKEIDNIKGNIKFNNVLYGYRHDPTLKDFSIEFKENTITAITGKTGCGKTGVFDLLSKLNRQLEGSIMIDNIDISTISDDSYYNLMSVARKVPYFFNMSIKDNLLMVGSDESQMVKVCESLGIHDKIMLLEKQYDTVISNNTNLLSSSDKKILAIARVLLKDSKIFLFDEVIEILDKSTIINVMNILKEKKKTHNIIIITRDKKILKQADNIVLIDQGQIKAIGHHNLLKRTSTLYNEII